MHVLDINLQQLARRFSELGAEYFGLFEICGVRGELNTIFSSLQQLLTCGAALLAAGKRMVARPSMFGAFEWFPSTLREQELGKGLRSAKYCSPYYSIEAAEYEQGLEVTVLVHNIVTLAAYSVVLRYPSARKGIPPLLKLELKATKTRQVTVTVYKCSEREKFDELVKELALLRPFRLEACKEERVDSWRVLYCSKAIAYLKQLDIAWRLFEAGMFRAETAKRAAELFNCWTQQQDLSAVKLNKNEEVVIVKGEKRLR
ncbi:MAG: hypothetical protein GXO42_00980 [bacterium]|nr:hypothetical protein [bacterium]